MAPLQSYQSFNSAHEGHEEDPLAPAAENVPAPRRISVSVGTTLCILGLLCVALIAALPNIPTEQEIEIARAYDLPLLGSAKKIRKAQKLADSYRTSYLDPTPNFENVVKRVYHKHAAKHYAEPPEGCEATIIIVRRKCCVYLNCSTM